MAIGKKTGGRRVGTPNKSTAEARKNIGLLLDKNLHRLSEWINQVAEGIKESRVSKDGSLYSRYLVRPNPAKAFDMLQSLLEFHVPKLRRVHVIEDVDFQIENNIDIFAKLITDLRECRRREV